MRRTILFPSCDRFYIRQTGRCINDQSREHQYNVTKQISGHLGIHCCDWGCTPDYQKSKIPKRSSGNLTNRSWQNKPRQSPLVRPIKKFVSLLVHVRDKVGCWDYEFVASFLLHCFFGCCRKVVNTGGGWSRTGFIRAARSLSLSLQERVSPEISRSKALNRRFQKRSSQRCCWTRVSIMSHIATCSMRMFVPCFCIRI